MTHPRTIFAEEFSSDRFLRIVVYGDWNDDMAETLKSFIELRQRRSAPVDRASHNSGERLPDSDVASSGADTADYALVNAALAPEQDK